MFTVIGVTVYVVVGGLFIFALCRMAAPSTEERKVEDEDQLEYFRSIR